MKRFLSFMFTLCAMLVLTCTAVGIMANVQSTVAHADTTTKFEVVGGTEVNGVLTFEYGAPIKVTPYGTGTDWIGIAPKGKVSKGGIRWAYIAEGEGNATKYSPAVVGAGSGVTIDIRYAFASDAHMVSNANTNDTTTGTADITPGEWTIFWVASNGSAGKYDTASAVDIVVTDGPMSLEKATFYVGDAINVTTNGTVSGAESTTVEKGTSVTVIAETVEGKTFLHWEIDGTIVSEESEYTFVANDSNVKVKAVFEDKKSEPNKSGCGQNAMDILGLVMGICVLAFVFKKK